MSLEMPCASARRSRIQPSHEAPVVLGEMNLSDLRVGWLASPHLRFRSQMRDRSRMTRGQPLWCVELVIPAADRKHPQGLHVEWRYGAEAEAPTESPPDLPHESYRDPLRRQGETPENPGRQANFAPERTCLEAEMKEVDRQGIYAHASSLRPEMMMQLCLAEAA
jgi:hypothetical protein